MSTTNLAYDFSRFESSAVKKKEEPAQQTLIKAKKISTANKANPRIIASLISLGMLAGGVIFCNAQEASIQNEITKSTKSVEMLASENARMKSELERKTSLTNVEDYAENELGLQKLDKSQIEYIQLQTENVVEIPENSSNVFIMIKNKFNDAVEYLRG